MGTDVVHEALERLVCLLWPGEREAQLMKRLLHAIQLRIGEVLDLALAVWILLVVLVFVCSKKHLTVAFPYPGL